MNWQIQRADSIATVDLSALTRGDEFLCSQFLTERFRRLVCVKMRLRRFRDLGSCAVKIAAVAVSRQNREEHQCPFSAKYLPVPFDVVLLIRTEEGLS